MDWPEFSTDESPLAVIAKLSRFYGSDLEFVIAGGGNTSCKDDQHLYIKPSGTALATITETDFVALDRGRLQAILEADFGSDPNAREAAYKRHLLSTRVDPESTLRPSVESIIHHLVPGRYVVHTHCTLGNRISCASRGADLCRELFGDDVLWQPYVDPGYTLSQAIAQALRAREKSGLSRPRAILMQNHGLIVAGDSPTQIRDDTTWFLDTIRRHCQELSPTQCFPMPARPQRTAREVRRLAPLLRGLLSENGVAPLVRFSDDEWARQFVIAGGPGEALSGGGPLTPDQIVYCKSFPLWFRLVEKEDDSELLARLREAVAAHVKTTGFPPRVVLVERIGLFAIGADAKAARIVQEVYTDAIKIMLGMAGIGSVNFLSARDREFIDGWEVEQFRRQVAAADQSKGRAAGKVVMVTGAAQGFGLGIAETLAAQGAHVVLADLNVEGAESAAAALSERFGEGRGLGLGLDVAEPESVAAAVDVVLRRFGGLDVLISNAGVLRAGSVVDLPPSDFDLVTRVNYRGYFVCVQQVAPVMARQHSACRRLWGDIIQINSKSGLVGSNKNGAYAGSKFGGIGLTQSFALELVDQGIKVNAVCPGNFFDGPLWSHPENGLFVQYLRTGKVPGAKTVEDVRAAYESKVPMGRGCTVADVMCAIFYLIEQAYETGQALPVGGGQVMLS